MRDISITSTLAELKEATWDVFYANPEQTSDNTERDVHLATRPSQLKKVIDDTIIKHGISGKPREDLNKLRDILKTKAVLDREDV